MQMAHRTPYRLNIFGQCFQPVRRLKKRTEIALIGYGVMGWTPTQHYQDARLPGAGSFLFAGMHEVRRAAMEALAQPNITQVSIRTNQDRQVYRYFKHADGSIGGYSGE